MLRKGLFPSAIAIKAVEFGVGLGATACENPACACLMTLHNITDSRSLSSKHFESPLAWARLDARRSNSHSRMLHKVAPGVEIWTS
jgi:hypothetical protein